MDKVTWRSVKVMGWRPCVIPCWKSQPQSSRSRTGEAFRCACCGRGNHDKSQQINQEYSVPATRRLNSPWVRGELCAKKTQMPLEACEPVALHARSGERNQQTGRAGQVKSHARVMENLHSLVQLSGYLSGSTSMGEMNRLCRVWIGSGFVPTRVIFTSVSPNPASFP